MCLLVGDVAGRQYFPNHFGALVKSVVDVGKHDGAIQSWISRRGNKAFQPSIPLYFYNFLKIGAIFVIRILRTYLFES